LSKAFFNKYRAVATISGRTLNQEEIRRELSLIENYKTELRKLSDEEFDAIYLPLKQKQDE